MVFINRFKLAKVTVVAVETLVNFIKWTHTLLSLASWQMHLIQGKVRRVYAANSFGYLAIPVTRHLVEDEKIP
jgi:hypothetical protein